MWPKNISNWKNNPESIFSKDDFHVHACNLFEMRAKKKLIVSKPHRNLVSMPAWSSNKPRWNFKLKQHQTIFFFLQVCHLVAISIQFITDIQFLLIMEIILIIHSHKIKKTNFLRVWIYLSNVDRKKENSMLL